MTQKDLKSIEKLDGAMKSGRLQDRKLHESVVNLIEDSPRGAPEVPTLSQVGGGKDAVTSRPKHRKTLRGTKRLRPRTLQNCTKCLETNRDSVQKEHHQHAAQQI